MLIRGEKEARQMADWDQVEGTVKEKAGDVTDDEQLESEGKAQGAWGDAKDTVGDKVDDAVDAVRDRT
jgi:uncharacterized protein YjbJ (UPF0337 family)